ncbi:MAG: serine hydrolase, partial [Pseudomonadales bacterium]|nr:serine hydrolase [Pseudomonadales bacterium]
MTVTSETAERAALYAGSQQSSAVAVWQRGELLVDKHWPVAGDGAYGAMQLGETDDGEPLEDVASIQKSIVSVLVGMAVRQELLTVTDPVHLWLGKGWSQASAAQEQSITLHHLLSMTSGLSTELTFEVPAGSRWAYNTNVYSRLVPVLERASGTDIGPLSQTWLIGPAGMTHTSWYERAF